MSIKIAEQVSITGIFLKQTYESDDGSFKIFIVQADYDEKKFPDGFKHDDDEVQFFVKGNVAAPSYPGQAIEVVGEWRYDTKYKNFSFSAEYLIQTLPKTYNESIRFLKSNGIVGDVIAKRIMDAFPSLEEAIKDPTQLMASVKGVTSKKAAAICNAVKAVNAVRELTILLKDKVSASVIRKICLKYSTEALDVVNNNPYKMYAEKVLTFVDADAVALAVGWDKCNKVRIQAGIMYTFKCLKIAYSSIIIDKDKLLIASVHVLGIDEAIVESEIENMRLDRHIVSAKDRWYLFEDYEVERDLAENIVKFAHSKVNAADEKRFIATFEKWKKKNSVTLAENQEKAVRVVASNQLTILTGGPGTGKTSTLKAILDTYKEAFPSSNITLMAPTGLAAKRMRDVCDAPANTIHKVLNLYPSESDSGFDASESISIDGGLIVVDEFSMVGIHLAGFLFSNIVLNNDTRIVLIGDVDQLPSVSLGSILEDLISCKKVVTTKLNKNFRQEAGSPIIDGAISINEGNYNKLKFSGDFQFKKVENKDIDLETRAILDEVKRAFEQSVKTYGLDNTYVLCPMRKKSLDGNKQTTTKTLLSTSSLNPILRDIVNPPSANLNFYRNFRENDRVINLKNTKDVMNGEIGFIRSILKVDGIMHVVVNYDGVEVEYTPDTLNNIELAYCITVHKAQGGQYESVIFPASMTQSAMLQRNLFYTAVTRAKKSFLVIGSEKSIQTAVKTVKNNSKRDLLAARIVYNVDKRGI